VQTTVYMSLDAEMCLSALRVVGKTQANHCTGGSLAKVRYKLKLEDEMELYACGLGCTAHKGFSDSTKLRRQVVH
jgi:hypothetical protein